MLQTISLLALSLPSAYGVYISYTCITRLRRYEERTEKAAQYSNTAAERLHKTRTTQGSAAITILLSLITSLTLPLLAHPDSSALTLGVGLVNTATTLAARIHVNDFWNSKAKVPFVEGYNEAIEGTEELVKVLSWLAGGWGVLSVVGLGSRAVWG